MFQLSRIYHSTNERAPAISCGTTIIAAEFDGGVVIGADSRSSAGGFASNPISDKLTELTPLIFCCRSGGAADTQAIADVVKYHLSIYEREHNCKAPVSVAANVFRDMVYRYRDDLSAGILVAGWDPKEGGQVYAVPPGGMVIRKRLSAGGSGSSYIYGYLDGNYRPNMSLDQCQDMVKTAVALAIARDGSSGGVIRMGTITQLGIVRQLFAGDQIPVFEPEIM